MTNYRIASISYFTSSSFSTRLGRESFPYTASVTELTSSLTRAWGIMTQVGAPTSGSVKLEGGGSILLQQLTPGQIYPCYPTLISVSAGSASVLS
jgi:hypothetical protein